MKKAFLLIFFHVALTLGTFFLVISLVFGEFPPPVEKVVAQFKQLRGLVQTGSNTDLARVANDRARRLDAALEVADDKPGAALPPSHLSPGANHPSSTQVISPPGSENVMSELRQLRLKIQDLEAHQQEQLGMIRKIQAGR